MQDLTDYARKNGITLKKEGPCQFCGANVTHGVFECLKNVHHIEKVLNFNDPASHVTRFLSVDAMALQHCEIHGPWNNHIHLTRLYLILEKNVEWSYSKTPQLSNIINHYKKDKTEVLAPPPLTQRGKLTTSDLLKANTPEECIVLVKHWARDVYGSFKDHHTLVSSIGEIFIEKYYS